MSKILLTGITGYLGSSLAKKLLSEHEVYGLVREPVNLTYLQEIQNGVTLLPFDGTAKSVSQAMEQVQPELVYHMATHYTGSHAMQQVEQMLCANVTFGAYLLEAMAEQGVRKLIYTTTVMEHYQGETYNPLNLYAATKRAFFDLMCYYAQAGFLEFGTVVLSDTYGPKDKRGKILNLIRQAAEKGESIDLSDGQQDYALVYVDDVTRALYLAGQQLCAGQWKNQTYQVIPKEILSLRETVECMKQVCNMKVQTNWGVRSTPERDMRKAVVLYPPVPGWEAEISLKKGLKDMV